jgi:hypothetical protein
MRPSSSQRPVIEEFDQTAEITSLSRCLPILEHGEEQNTTPTK